MATRHFDNASLGAVPDPLMPLSLLMKGYPAPLGLIRPQEADEMGVREDDWRSSAFAESGNIGRCIRWAFAIEGGAAALICGIWALCHFLW